MSLNFRQAQKVLDRGQPLVADFYDTREGKQRRIRVVRLENHRYFADERILHGINGEVSEKLHLSRVVLLRA